MDATSEIQPPPDGPVGIGGWLILPVLGIVLTPLRGLSQLSSVFAIWTTDVPVSPVLRIVGSAESLANIVLLFVLPLIILYHLVNKNTAFPRLYVVWGIANVIFTFASLFFFWLLLGDAARRAGLDLIDASAVRDIIAAFAFAVIWIPYMRLSRRVKNTFVN